MMNVISEIPGQLNEQERQILTESILKSAKRPRVVVEVGTWLGGGSTVHLLRALECNGEGHLWGIEVDRTIYEQMLENIRRTVPDAVHRFTPMFGNSQDVLRRWLAEQKNDLVVDLVFLDGGNNPGEQITEFKLLEPYMPVGSQLLAHDALMRKGKWLVPYLMHLDNWRIQLHKVSSVGLLHAEKISLKSSPAGRRAAAICLFKLRLNPVEIAAAVLPSKVCGAILSLLPVRLARRLSDGVR